MIEFTAYDPNTGRITANYGVPDESFEDYKNIPKVIGVYNFTTQYIENNKAVDRPVFNLSINKQMNDINGNATIKLKRNEYLIITNIPNNTNINISSSQNNDDYIINDTMFEWASRVDGAFRVNITNFPYQDIIFDIIVEEA